jgi:hypothetical protein
LLLQKEMPPKRSVSTPPRLAAARPPAGLEPEPEPQPEPQPQPPPPPPEPQPAPASAGHPSIRFLRSASEACLSALAAEPEPEPELRECCICLTDWPVHAADFGERWVHGVTCASGHFTCADCLASYVESEMAPARLAKNSGRVGCAACYDTVGPIGAGAGGEAPPEAGEHHAFSEKQLRDTLRTPEALGAYERGQQRLVERLLLDESLVCPSCGYFELVDRPEVAEEFRVRGRVWTCAGCDARSCHRCLPPMVLAPSTDGAAHRCRRSGSAIGAGAGGAANDTERQLYHQLAEVLTQGHVGYCPRGCPTPLVKDQGCNCMQCVQPGCSIYFCFLCNADLGDDSREAHRSHFRADACWMFDGGEKTLELAHAHRTHALVYAYTHTRTDAQTHRRSTPCSCTPSLPGATWRYQTKTLTEGAPCCA